jgi:hypothetical protein
MPIHKNVAPLRGEGHLGAPSGAESDIEELKVAVHKDKGVVRQGKNAGAAAKAERVPAELVIHPSVNAALVIKKFSEVFGDSFNVPFNMGELAARLKDGLNDISKNDLAARRCCIAKRTPCKRSSLPRRIAPR